MLTSVQNYKVKEWKKLHKRKYRNRENRFLVEGYHLVEEALKSDWNVVEMILREDISYEVPDGVEPFKVSSKVFDTIAETETPQGIAAVVEQKQWDFKPASLTLVVDAVQDPGNLGTMIRTADAAGFDQIIFGSGTVDPYNDKVLRSTQGSVFHIPFHQGDLKDFLPVLKENGVQIWASTLNEKAAPYNQLSAPKQAALIVGNEGQGVNEEWIGMADEQVYIPIYGQAESLNVSIAAAVMMYHLKN
ncbi:TrmH family RNA methyltransferase [Halobacillus yeomjeoni]|uniref:RNA methyltransferase n=1 Tax=Halobacillus yeomjeoni TaxID=311194 RepID=A0A931MV11_9BACI|nr:RNA methyltransferase [Halobacillus yeomjeoni]MBH0230100.1 RNA methyltransferase [Halobacillus yeomjeoni]